MQIGAMSLEGGQWLHFQQTDDGMELNAGWEGSVAVLGGYLSHRQEGSFVLDEDGATVTYFDEIGVGIKGLGGFHVTSETQIRSDLTLGGTSATQGAYAALVDEHGNDWVGGGVFADTKDGLYTSGEHLDDQRDYERDYDEPELPAAPDGGANTKFGGGERAADGAEGETRSAAREQGAAVPRDAFDQFGDRVETDGPDRAAASRTTERDLGLDEVREPIGSVDANSDAGLDAVRGAAGPPRAAGETVYDTIRGADVAAADDRGGRSVADSATPRLRDRNDDLDLDLDEAGAGLPHKSVARDVDAVKALADSATPRLRDRGGDVDDDGVDLDGAGAGLPHKALADSATPRLRDRGDDLDLDEAGAGLPHKSVARDVDAVKALADSATPRLRDRGGDVDDDGVDLDGAGAGLPHKALADSATPRLRDRGDDLDLDEAGAGLPHKSVARDVDAVKALADSATPRLRDRGGDDVDLDGAGAGLPHKVLADSATPRLRDRGVDDVDDITSLATDTPDDPGFSSTGSGTPTVLRASGEPMAPDDPGFVRRSDGVAGVG